MVPGLNHPRIATLIGLIVVVAALYLAKSLLVLFAVAMLLAFALAPAVSRIQRLRTGRIPAVVIVLLVALLAVGGTGWIVAGQVDDVVENLAKYSDNLRSRFTTVTAIIRQPIEKAQRTVADITRESAPASRPPDFTVSEVKEPNPTEEIDGILGPLSQVAGFFGSISLVILLCGIMLIQREDMRDRLIRLAGGGRLSVTTQAIDEASGRVSRYLLATSAINGLHGLALAVGLFLIGLPNVLLWGLLAAILRWIPYLGPWMAAAFPITLSLAISPDWTMPLLTIGLILVLETVSNNLIEPWIYGTQTGISPGAVIIAAIFWTWIWGMPGLFLATPLTVCLAVMGKYVAPLRFLHILLGNEPALSPDTKLYQRLLARDKDEASTILAKELESRSDIEVFDDVLIPALALAERDLHQGAIEERTLDSIADAMALLLENLDERPRDEEDEDIAPLPGAPSVLCVSAEDSADRVAALMTQWVLSRAGFPCEIVSAGALTGALPERLETFRPDIVLISNFPPSGFAMVRFLVRRLLARRLGKRLVVGLWGSTEDAQRMRERLPGKADVTIVRSLAEVVAVVHAHGPEAPSATSEGGARSKSDSRNDDQNGEPPHERTSHARLPTPRPPV